MARTRGPIDAGAEAELKSPACINPRGISRQALRRSGVQSKKIVAGKKIKLQAIACAVSILLLDLYAFSQGKGNDDLSARIVGAAMTRGGAISFLETLTDTIGGRVTGSEESREASKLILKTLREAGFDNAHIEDYSFSPRWQRGPATGWVASPVKRALYIGSYGWGPGTNGRVEVP